jgi:prevent-host-death family protein
MHVSITKAKGQLEELIAKAIKGEEIVICRRGEPMVRLERISTSRRKGKATIRKSGRLRGQISLAPNAFEPLTDRELKDLGFE